ncbi:hypothetical protein AL073_14930 [Loktanella sp. 1ANDIMAR09]|nr:hypothetical protein AL073_14930 [Loktanella sp. 1ANDIMAR09]
MRLLKQNLALALLVLIGIFAVQNAARVDYVFLVWTIELRRSAVVVLCVATGILIGWLIGTLRKRQHEGNK